MSLIKCKECGNEISKKADKCPNCGAPNKAKTSGCAWLFLIGVVVVVLAGITGSPGGSGGSASSAPETPKTPEELREDKIKSGFSAWDGSHRELTKIIKKSMNDPKSYEHVETVYWDRDDHLIVKTSFRGKNAFGGVVVNWVRAKCSLDGSVLSVIEQGP